MVVSGRLRARASWVKEEAESPRPWRRRRMLGVGCEDWEEDVEDWGGVIVMVRLEGKSEGWGVLVGIFRGSWDFLLGVVYKLSSRL